MRVRKKYNDGGEIAKTILEQLGGAGLLHAMTGAYNFVNIGNGLSFKIKNQRANYIKITLTSLDLYDIEVGRIRGNTYKVVAEEDGLYSDQLKPFIEKSTGMYLTMPRFAKYADGGMVTVKSDDGEDLSYKIDTDDKMIEVNRVTKQYLTDIVLVMNRDFRKLGDDKFIFWYDEMSDDDIEELEELFKTSLSKYAKGGKLKSNPEDEWECSECGRAQGRHDMWFEGDLCEKCHEHSKEEFLEDMSKLHKDIKEITLKDGTKVTHSDLAKANNVMAKGGNVSNPYEEFLLANGFRKSLEVKKDKYTEYRKGRWYCSINKATKEIEVGKYDLDYSDADIKKYGGFREDDAPYYHSDRYTNSFTKFKKFLHNYYILDEQDVMADGGEMEDYGFDDDRWFLIEDGAGIIKEKLRKKAAYALKDALERRNPQKKYSVIWIEDYESDEMEMAKGGMFSSGLNVYTLVSSKEYFGTDTGSDRRRWFRRNGPPLTREEAYRMGERYIEKYGKDRVKIGYLR